MSTPGSIIATRKGTSGTTYRLRYEEGTSGPTSLYVGTGADSVNVGYVAHVENLDYAVDVADEELRCLVADFRRDV
jgi:hypothetical protein